MARPGIVHRIDKDTSGLLIVAKNDFSHNHLAQQIQAHSFTREYSAVVYGAFKEDSGTVDQPLGRHPTDRKKMAVLPQSPSARRLLRISGWSSGFKALLSCASGWKQGAPIKSGCIWRFWAIP